MRYNIVHFLEILFCAIRLLSLELQINSISCRVADK